MWSIFTNGGELKRWSLMIPSAFPLWEMHLCESYECSKPWLERPKNTKLGLEDTIRKVLKRRCLKFLHIVHLDLICMSYDQKKGQSQIGNLTLDHKSLDRSAKLRSNWSVLRSIGKIFSRAIRYCPHTLKLNFIW